MSVHDAARSVQGHQSTKANQLVSVSEPELSLSGLQVCSEVVSVLAKSTVCARGEFARLPFEVQNSFRGGLHKLELFGPRATNKVLLTAPRMRQTYRKELGTHMPTLSGTVSPK